MSDCLFCKIAAGEIPAEADLRGRRARRVSRHQPAGAGPRAGRSPPAHRLAGRRRRRGRGAARPDPARGAAPGAASSASAAATAWSTTAAHPPGRACSTSISTCSAGVRWAGLRASPDRVLEPRSAVGAGAPGSAPRRVPLRRRGRHPEAWVAAVRGPPPGGPAPGRDVGVPRRQGRAGRRRRGRARRELAEETGLVAAGLEPLVVLFRTTRTGLADPRLPRRRAGRRGARCARRGSGRGTRRTSSSGSRCRRPTGRCCAPCAGGSDAAGRTRRRDPLP